MKRQALILLCFLVGSIVNCSAQTGKTPYMNRSQGQITGQDLTAVELACDPNISILCFPQLGPLLAAWHLQAIPSPCSQCSSRESGTGNSDQSGMSNASASDLQVASFVGNDLGAKIENCISSLPSSGGTCDARSLVASQKISSTIKVPANVEILLGRARIAATVTPAFILSDNDILVGEGHKDNSSPPDGTTITLTGTRGGSAIQLASNGHGSKTPGGSAANVKIQSLEVVGVSTSDGSIGLDLQGMLDGAVSFVDVRRFQTGIRLGFGDWPWNCDCYNYFEDDEVISAAIGVDFQWSANKDTWIGGTVQPFGLSGTGFRLAGTNDVIISPDVENFKSGIAFDFVTTNHHVLSPWIESGGTAVQFEASSNDNQLIGGTTASLLKGGVIYMPGASTETNVVQGLANAELWPKTWGAATMEFWQGSTPNYYRLYAQQSSAQSGLDLIYNPDTQAQSVYGKKGHAPLSVGFLTDYGSLKESGRASFSALANPIAPEVTNVGTAGTTLHRYAVVCFDRNGGSSLQSATGQSKTGNSSLNPTNYNVITWNCPDGFDSSTILKFSGGSWHTLAAKQGAVSTKLPLKDIGQALSAYVAPARNTTADLSVGGSAVAKEGLGPAESVLWKTGKGSPSGSCSSGSLFTNQAGTPSGGNNIYVCSQGAWIEVK